MTLKKMVTLLFNQDSSHAQLMMMLFIVVQVISLVCTAIARENEKDTSVLNMIVAQ